MAAFVASGMRMPDAWRRPLRIAAIAGFALLAVLALLELGLWWASGTW